MAMGSSVYDIYQMTEERQKELWSDCIFVFDASALLALYLYPEEARQHIYKEIFEKIKGRLWLPHHAFFEYLKNRESKIKEPISRSYQPLNIDYIKPILESVTKSLNRVDGLRNAFKNSNSHPYMVAEAVERYERQLKDFVSTTLAFGKTFNEQTQQKIDEILQLEQKDTVFEHIQKYFKVGREYSYDEILKITVEGKHRYEFKIPPGYEDLKDKIGTQIFGDLIIWKQILEYSGENKKNIVFVCNDLKEDWWQLVSDTKAERKRPVGPRRELIKELRDHSGTAFWMYNPARFLDIANSLISSNIPNKYIEQIARLGSSTEISKWIVYTCNTCKHTDAVDLTSLSLNFETIADKGRNKHTTQSHFSCRHCTATIDLQLEVLEDEQGTIKDRRVILKNAVLVDEAQIEEYLIEAQYDEKHPVEDEILILDKKQLRLKAGKERQIRFKEKLEGEELLFQVDLESSAKKAGRLLVEIPAGKYSKTLVLDKGITRFVLRNDDEQFVKTFSSIRLMANNDMTLQLTITRYPGAGRYLEKLYY